MQYFQKLFSVKENKNMHTNIFKIINRKNGWMYLQIREIYKRKVINLILN